MASIRPAIPLFALLTTGLIPGLAYANAGAPILLLFSFLAFLYGFVIVVAVESLVFWKVEGRTLKVSLMDMTFANLASTLIIGFGIPLLIAIAGAISMMLPSPYREIGTVASTWFYDGGDYLRHSFKAALFWLLLLYLSSVYFESWALKKWYQYRRLERLPTSRRWSWIGNSITYLGMAIAFVLMWGEVM